MGFFMLMFVIIFGALATAGSFVTAARPSKRKVRNDIDSIRNEMKEESVHLVPWKKEEIELFSLNQSNKKKRRGWSTNLSGYFTNIYHEKVLLYYLKRYSNRGKNAVVFARNSVNEYIYNVSREGVEIYIDEYYLGFLQANGELHDTKNRKKIAQMDRESQTSKMIIYVDNQPIGAVARELKEDTKIKQRAFEPMRLGSEKNQQIFLALGFFHLIMQEVNN